MTVQTDLAVKTYAGNGVTVNFAIPFRFLSNGHLLLSLVSDAAGSIPVPLVITTDYSIVGARSPNGGTATLVVPPASGYTLIIQRNMPFTQLVDYRANDPFPEESAENIADERTMEGQQINEQLGRTLTLPPQISGVNNLMPPPDPSKLWAWNADGTAVEYVTPAGFLVGTVAGGVFTTSAVEGQTVVPLPSFAVAVSISDVYFNGIRLDNGTYTISGGNATLSEALPVDGSLVFRFATVVPALNGDASGLTYTPEVVGTVARTQQQKMDDVLSVKDFGAKGDGVTDDTANLAKAFAYGGIIDVPDGDYFIAGTGPDSGGVYAVMTKDLHVRCSPRARFFTDSLDNDLIRLEASPSVPAGGVAIEWSGGILDQRNQKNSTSMPHTGVYPPNNPGTSATAEALSFRGTYNGPGPLCGFSRLSVHGATFIASTHWQTGGGDSAIYFDGCALANIDDCNFTGSRDVAIYASRDGTGVAGGPANVTNCRFLNCFFAVAMKRSLSGFTIANNECVNSLTAWQVAWVAGAGCTGGFIYGNREENCTRTLSIEYGKNIFADMGEAASMGALLANGTKAAGVYSAIGIVLMGATNCTIKGGRFTSVSAPWAADTYYMFTSLGFDPGSGVVSSTFNTYQDNIAVAGFTGAGTETIGQADSNLYVGNLAIGGATPNVSSLNTNSLEERRTQAGAKTYRQPLYFADGALATPIIARDAQKTTGIFFATNKVGIGVAGVERIAANNAGVGFNGTTPVAKPTVTGSRGANAALASLLTAIAGTGLITDSTTV